MSAVGAGAGAAGAGTAAARVRAAYARLAEVDRPEVWISLRAEADALAEAERVDARAAAGQDLPLAGWVLAVKDNVDVAGLATTAACPGYLFDPAEDAPVVARLRAAGAVVLGKTNLDQFATGLVGTRSPHGAVRDSRRPDRISGGSSSGSAVAVALGVVDAALGTDTAGSGRVPAMLQGIVGLKATLGVVSTAGVVPACRSYDCVTVFAPDLPAAELVMGVAAGGPGTRAWPADAPLAAPPAPVVAVPRELPALSPAWRGAFDAAVERMRAAGARIVEVDLGPFLAAARLLYDGALVAERYAAVGDFVSAHEGDAAAGLDPTVAGIVTRAGGLGAHQLVADLERLEQLRAVAMAQLEGADALLVPTAPEHPTLAAVAADPVGVNSRMGTYTNFANLFDLCAVAVPTGTAPDDGGEAQFGVTVVARAFHDAVAADVARMLTPAGSSTGTAPAWPRAAGAAGVELLVVGAHLRGQPLAHELVSRGARWAGPVRTSSSYRLVRLATTPPRPGLLRTAEPAAGAPDGIAGELWVVPPSGLASFLAALPPPMLLGAVELADGRWVTGFACDAAAGAAGEDITAHGGWLAAQARP